jgi:hypothetical protein
VSAEAAETARRIQLLREQHRAAITDKLGRAAGNGHRVLESLFDRPIVAVNDVRGMTGTTYAAANSLVSKLVNIGVLSEITGYARNRRFRYAPYIVLFADSQSPQESGSRTSSPSCSMNGPRSLRHHGASRRPFMPLRIPPASTRSACAPPAHAEGCGYLHRRET